MKPTDGTARGRKERQNAQRRHPAGTAAAKQRSGFRELLCLGDSGRPPGYCASVWILRGLNGRDDVTTIEVMVSSDHIVTMVADPGISPSTVEVEAELTVEGQPEVPFITLQHRPIPERPGATVFAPVDLNGLKALLEALWQCAGMKLTMISGGQALLQAPLYNDPSYRKVFARV